MFWCTRIDPGALPPAASPQSGNQMDHWKSDWIIGMAFLKKRDSANILDPKTANGDIADLKKSFKSSGQKRKRAEKPGDQRKSLRL